MREEEHLEVVGDQPEILSWLLPGVASAVGERADRWTYEHFELGSPTEPDVRVELRSPTRDASIVVSAAASHASGLFTAADPVRVSVRRTSAPDPRGLGAVLGRRPGEVDRIQRQLVELVQRQSTPVPEPDVPAGPVTGNASEGGFGPRPGLPPPRVRQPRNRRPLLALVVLLAVVALGWWTLSGGLASFVANLGASGGSSPSASPSSAQTTVIKGKKPKGAKACSSTFTSAATPKHSAKGNKNTTCGFAEEVRKSYIQKGSPGKTVSLPKVRSPQQKRSYTVTCKGRNTITCRNKTKALVFLY